jgi:small-conductance mechanosensitive channel
LIPAAALAKADVMTPKVERTLAWFLANLDALLLGLVVAVALVAVMLLLRAFGRRLVVSDPECASWRYVIGRVLAKTTLLFMIFAALDIVTTYAEPPTRIGRLFDIGFVIAFALQGAVWGRELILGVIGRQTADDQGESTLGNALSVMRVLISVALFGVAFIVILDNLGINVTALIAGLGIGGIAIGLAAQGIFADLFAALAILFDKPFRRGDTIRYDQSTGTVEKIGLKTTRLRSLTGEQLIMANTKLLEREIHNYAQATARRMTIYFAVEAHTPGDKLAQVPALAGEAVAAVTGCKLVRCAANAVGTGAIGFELVFDDRALDNNRIAQDRSAVLLALIERLRSAEIEIERASELPPPLAPF